MEVSDTLFEYFKLGYKGTLVEVGAGHPVNISNSLVFRDFKWSIISVEPIPEHCDEFRKMGFDVLQYAASNKDTGITKFKVSPNLICCSGLEIRYKEDFGWEENDFRVIDVVAFTLNSILKVHHPEIKNIDILIVDAEGFEIEVMQGFDLKMYNPKVVCIEGHESEAYMLSHGYKLDKQIGQDKIFINGFL